MKQGQMPLAVLRGVIGDEHIEDIRLRNKHRAQQVIQQLGNKYCCHPNYKPAPVRRQSEEA